MKLFPCKIQMLIFYDCCRVGLIDNNLDGKLYLLFMVDELNMLYVALPLTTKQKQKLRSKRGIDFRAVLDAHRDECYLIAFGTYLEYIAGYHIIDIPDEWLPDDGLMIKELR